MCKSQGITYVCGHYYQRLVSVCNGSVMTRPNTPQGVKNSLACHGNGPDALVNLNYKTECPDCLRNKVDNLRPQDLPAFPDHEYPLILGTWGEEVESNMTYFDTEKLRRKQALPDPDSHKSMQTLFRKPRMRDWTKNPDFDEKLNPGARLLKKKYRKHSILKPEVKRSDIPNPPKDPFDLSDDDQVATGWGLRAGGDASAGSNGLDWVSTNDGPATSYAQGNASNDDTGYASYVAAGYSSNDDIASASYGAEYGSARDALSGPYDPMSGLTDDTPSASYDPAHDWSDDPTLPQPAPGPPPSEHHVWGGWGWIDTRDSSPQADEWDADMAADDEFDENNFDFGEDEDSNANIDPLLLAAGRDQVNGPAANVQVPAIGSNSPEPDDEQAADVGVPAFEGNSPEDADLFFAAVEEALEQTDEPTDRTSAVAPAAASTAVTNNTNHSSTSDPSPAIDDDMDDDMDDEIDYFIESDFDSSDSEFSLRERDYIDKDPVYTDWEAGDLDDHSGPCTRRNPGGFNLSHPIYDVVEKHGGVAGQQAQCARCSLGGEAKEVKTVIEVNKTQGFAIITSPNEETFGDRLRQRNAAGKVMNEAEYCVMVWTSKA